MNSLDHQRLNWLLAAGVVLAAGAVGAQCFGFGTTPSWDDDPVLSTPPMRMPKSIPLPEPIGVAYEQVWHRNVFSTTRQADPQPTQAAEDPLSGYRLTGVILSGALRIALLTDPNGKGQSVITGHTVPHTDWVLKTLTHREAHFDVDGQDVPLSMHPPSYPTGPLAVPGGPGDTSANTAQGAPADANGQPSSGDHPVTPLPPLPPGM